MTIRSEECFIGATAAAADTQQVQDNRVLLHRFYEEIFNQGIFSTVDEIVAPEFVDHVPDPMGGKPTKGPEAVIWFASMFREAFPDLHVAVDELLVADGQLVARVTWSGTQTGPLFGADPTGKQVKVMGIDLVHIVHGKIIEHWGQVDVLGMLAQLGFLPI